MVVRSEPEGMTPEQATTAGEFEAGLVEGATTGGVVTVGVS